MFAIFQMVLLTLSYAFVAGLEAKGFFKKRSATIFGVSLFLLTSFEALAEEPAMRFANPGPPKGGLIESPPVGPWMFLEVELKGSVHSVKGDSLIIHLPGRYLPENRC